MIRVLQPRIRLDGTALVSVVGAAPWAAVAWSCSSGTVEPFSGHTDATGRASAIWTPAAEGLATIEVTCGA